MVARISGVEGVAELAVLRRRGDQRVVRKLPVVSDRPATMAAARVAPDRSPRSVLSTFVATPVGSTRET